MKDLYYVLMYNKIGNVKECKTLIKKGLIKVNGIICLDACYKVNFDDCITYQNQTLNSQPFIYYMLNKPADCLCAHHDKIHQTVMDYIDRDDCYCLGRLDKDTTGLLILTNDKSLSKRLLLPQNHVQKKYYVTTQSPLTKKIKETFLKGVIIDNNISCLPAKLDIIDDYHCYVTIQEGKYHQIKKMFLSCNNQVVALKRVQFGSLVLDETLKKGQYRPLTQKEIISLLS